MKVFVGVVGEVCQITCSQTDFLSTAVEILDPLLRDLSQWLDGLRLTQDSSKSGCTQYTYVHVHVAKRPATHSYMGFHYEA